MSDDVETRLARLEARVAQLEGRDKPPHTSPSGGSVAYQGDVHLHGDVEWSIGYSPDAILDLSVARTSEVLASLGHPVRLQIVRTLLRGPANASALQEAVELGSTGQVYHHLKALSSAGVVEQHARGEFRIAATKVVPLLVSMLAAADISGELRT
ncbi:ArsR/SmtB family transcription factor [Rhodococcoides kyotonense]|uniref:Helix-turn-helix domain-containing protein n=1 Tax=Rhodococcoides kyotonense TaxID=398843 RepID=A0A239NC44_9NOCA|nr:helix-turn-helix domain-containing protein [Rhodococcus kyotonensis]SNT52062.1 Helix-turn-helix domain-containing protein [Rhodococcus kyotonensis]